ncbi:MAG: DUF2357 domain-containing protein [Bacteroidetes bacterium]|nr:DUF2357 domain-containing protein [Bacteroidota bacterium]
MRHALTYPWETIQFVYHTVSAPVNIDNIHWHSQILTDRESEITNATTGGTFPTVSISKNYKVIELPGPAIKGDMSREIVLDIDNKHKVSFLFNNNDSKPDNTEMLDQFEFFFDQTMNVMLYLVRMCLKVEKHSKENIYWEKIINQIHKDMKDDPAKYALVVDLARLPELIEPVGRITEKPKRVLRRIHDQERIQKVQEIDTKCLTDLARRPGTVLAEKAGPKQRILAIKRKENINTLENRVTKHCCSLAALASKRYLREHDKIQKSERKESVQRLFRASKRLPQKSSFQGVVNLLEPCRQPNYTLMLNPDYYKVWKAYVQLVRNEDLRNELWKWHRRMWSDYMGLFLADLLHSYQGVMSDKYIYSIGQKTVFGKRKQDTGKWLISDTMPGPFIIEVDSDKPGTLYLINGDRDTLINVSDSLQDLAILNADYLLICIRSDRQVVLPIYAILPSHHLSNEAHSRFVKDILPSLMQGLRMFKEHSTSWSCRNGWVLLGNWAHSQDFDKELDLGEGMTCWATAIDPDYNSWQSIANRCYEPLLNVCAT